MHAVKMNSKKSFLLVLSLIVTPLLLFIYWYVFTDKKLTIVSVSQSNLLSTNQVFVDNSVRGYLTPSPQFFPTNSVNTKLIPGNNTVTQPLSKPLSEFTVSHVLPDRDCMDLRKIHPYPTTGLPRYGGNLCKIYRGTLDETDCVYNHPEIFNFILFKRTPWLSVLDFQAYLAIYSVHKFYKPDKIVIHSNYKLRSNNYWKRIKKLSTPIETNRVKRPYRIGGKRPGYITHEADYFKVFHAFKYGGIFADFDMVVLNGTRLREMQRRSEVLLGRDDFFCSRICAGFISCVPGSPLMRKWLDSYKNDYKPHSWLHNAGEVPSKILRSCKDCYDAVVDMDISNFDEVRLWGETGGIDWRRKPVAHYMNAGFMKPLKPVKEILKMSTSFAEMVKYVLGDTVKDFL